MTDGPEAFFAAHRFTIDALGAVSTLAAVIVSLVVSYLAQRAQRTTLVASADVSLIVEQGAEGEHPEYIHAIVRNIGNVPATVTQTFFFWTFPFQRAGWITLPRDASGLDDVVPPRVYPIEISPRRTATFFLFELGSFREIFAREYKKAGFIKRLKFRFIGAQVTSDDGRSFRVTIGNELKKEIRSLMTGRNRGNSIATQSPSVEG